MLDAAAPHARWIDVFCETRRLRRRPGPRGSSRPAPRAGLRGRLHANQLGPGPGVRLASELGLVAVDHCTYLEDADVDALRDSGTIATLLPGRRVLDPQPYPDARRLVDAGVRVALASDCNPGSCYTSSLPLCVALAVREMRMTPAEAVHAATSGAPRRSAATTSARSPSAAGRTSWCSTPPRHLHLAYRPGVPLVPPLEGRPPA